MAGMDEAQAQEFAEAFRGFLRWVHDDPRSERARNEVVALVRDFVDEAGRAHSVVSREFAAFEHVNLQVALDAWGTDAGREIAAHGYTLPQHHEPPELGDLISGEQVHGLRLCAPPLSDRPDGPGSTRGCMQRALLLVTDGRGRYVVSVTGPHRHYGGLRIEVAGLPTAVAQQVLAELDALRQRLNVYRGHVLDVAADHHSGISLTFAAVPTTGRDDVVLPEHVLGRVERHSLGVAAFRQELLAAGQHLKRGLLLYGPPGTGKTHTTRYLVGRMDGYTRLLLTGRSMRAIGAVAGLARDLSPAAILVEDVDLVAEDREFGESGNPVLFELLDAMDGTAGDADLLFLLTTNRADLLEPALAARPGRVDVAVEIGLPDAEARRRLFELYARGVPAELAEADIEVVVERTDGVTASFLKELLRRAVLESLTERSPLETVAARHVEQALDDLLDSTQGVTRTLLGVGGPQPAAGWPPSGEARPGTYVSGAEWIEDGGGSGWYADGG